MRPRLASVLAVAALSAALPFGGTAYANGCVTTWLAGEHPGAPDLVTVDEEGVQVRTDRGQAYAAYVAQDVSQLVRCVV